MKIQSAHTPRTAPKPEPQSRCKRSCCWSPYGHIVRTGCTCHTVQVPS